MKNNIFKRFLAILLVLVMAFSITACMGDSGSSGGSSNKNKEKEEDESSDTTDNTPAENELVKSTNLSDPDLQYVMIYNPKIYNENKTFDSSSLTTGSLSGQVDVYGNRGDGLKNTPEYTTIPQIDWKQYFSGDMTLEGDRADPMGIDYTEGDTHSFYYSSDGNMNARRKKSFTCAYSGKYCHIWTFDSISSSTIDALGKEFDDKIYEEVSSTFGTPRFVGETGKVNLLLYDMEGGLLGYFALLDLFVESELGSVGLKGTNCNTGHAIININASLLERSSSRELAYSTVAHELQHLINFSAYFNTANSAIMNTWLNEGMSGYIETELYSNSKELSGHYDSYNESNRIRNGQSLYNFATDSSAFSYDIGVYGSVYYFSKYLEKTAGEDIFSDIMDYWRESYSQTLCTSEALAKSVSTQTYTKIDKLIDFSPLKLTFDSKYDEWMSKMCLDFYLSTLSNDKNISEFNKIDQNSLLYDNIDGAKIEGGGRVIVALTGNSFNIPEDSDSGLIYVGLDKDFKPVTEFVYK